VPAVDQHLRFHDGHQTRRLQQVSAATSVLLLQQLGGCALQVF
jgi:hypothetical protein